MSCILIQNTFVVYLQHPWPYGAKAGHSRVGERLSGQGEFENVFIYQSLDHCGIKVMCLRAYRQAESRTEALETFSEGILCGTQLSRACALLMSWCLSECGAFEIVVHLHLLLLHYCLQFRDLVGILIQRVQVGEWRINKDL